MTQRNKYPNIAAEDLPHQHRRHRALLGRVPV